ncbi:hypothetical protein [Secundilactobacillus muriivasis]
MNPEEQAKLLSVMQEDNILQFQVERLFERASKMPVDQRELELRLGTSIFIQDEDDDPFWEGIAEKISKQTMFGAYADGIDLSIYYTGKLEMTKAEQEHAHDEHRALSNRVMQEEKEQRIKSYRLVTIDLLKQVMHNGGGEATADGEGDVKNWKATLDRNDALLNSADHEWFSPMQFNLYKNSYTRSLDDAKLISINFDNFDGYAELDSLNEDNSDEDRLIASDIVAAFNNSSLTNQLKVEQEKSDKMWDKLNNFKLWSVDDDGNYILNLDDQGHEINND